MLLDVLLDVLLGVPLDVLLEDAEFDVESTLLLVLLRDSELLDRELENGRRCDVEMLLIEIGETADVVKTLEVRLVTVFESAFDIEVEDTSGGLTLETVVGVVSETVMKA